MICTKRASLFSLVIGILLAGFLLCPGLLEAKTPGEYRTLKIFFENDLFGNTDKYYTNAVQLTWLSKDLAGYKEDVRLPRWTLPIIRRIPFADHPDSIHNVGLILGQQIYTPSNIESKRLLKDDRPYAGFLYGGLALHSKTESRLDTMEIVFGVVGPSALGEQAQNGIHQLRSIVEAQGWEHQLRDEPALSLSWQRKWRNWSWEADSLLGADLLTNSGVALGNVRTGANFGGEFRFGYRIPRDFGSDVIRPGAGVSAPLPSDQARATGGNFGLHAFVGAQLEGVARNIFLDGNTWKGSHSVDKKPLVADFSVGLAVSFETVKLTYRHLFRTKEFENQEQGQVIGSLTLTWAF
ncbi:MAG: lipid A deacylase LpxR family protein [Desulfohalobiaceae bacterium]|nr:lipid A deacylase LpxR family protein [Desulfohalobiaceae bacterium]